MREMVFECRRQIDYPAAGARSCVFDNDTRRGSVFFCTTPIVNGFPPARRTSACRRRF